MKKFKAIAAIIAASLSLTSCGLGTTSSTSTTQATGNILNGTLQTAGSGLLGSILGSLLGNTTSLQSLAGTWTYSNPKVVFESENVLSQIGGQVVSNSIEKKLGDQLSKMGFTAGKSVLVLNTDNTCSLTLGTKTATGTYSYDSSSNKLTMTGALGVGQVTCTVSVVGNELYMLFDADKLLAIATSLQTKNTSTLSSLLKNYTGLKLGWAMTK